MSAWALEPGSWALRLEVPSAAMRLTTRLAATFLMSLFAAFTVRAERPGYAAAEFTTRRAALTTALGHEGIALLFGQTMTPAGIRFRQDNDFYYLTGNEDLNAVLLMDLG